MKAQITIGLLAFFASVWILFEGIQTYYSDTIYAIVLVFLLLVVMLILSYVIIAILEWIKIFDLKTNAIIALVVLTAFMINLIIFLLKG